MRVQFHPTKIFFFCKKNFPSVAIHQKPLEKHKAIRFLAFLLFSTLPTANILKKSGGRDGFVIKLADFGVAKLMNKIHYGQLYTTTGAGTVTYMSPEALKDHERYGKPSDIWSLGAVISFICNERHLFWNPMEVAKWPGDKSSLDEFKYSIDLRRLTADMLCPTPLTRPTASKIVSEAKTGNRQEEKPVKEAAKDQAKEPTKERGKEPGKKPAKKPSKKPGKKPGEEPGKEPVTKPAKKPGKRAAKRDRGRCLLS